MAVTITRWAKEEHLYYREKFMEYAHAGNIHPSNFAISSRFPFNISFSTVSEIAKFHKSCEKKWGNQIFSIHVLKKRSIRELIWCHVRHIGANWGEYLVELNPPNLLKALPLPKNEKLRERKNVQNYFDMYSSASPPPISRVFVLIDIPLKIGHFDFFFLFCFKGIHTMRASIFRWSMKQGTKSIFFLGGGGTMYPCTIPSSVTTPLRTFLYDNFNPKYSDSR